MLRLASGTLVVLFGAASMTAAIAQTTKAPGQATQGQMQLTQSECESLWNQADAAGAGALTQTQAQPYVTNFSTVDANTDGRLSRTEFMQGCERGQVQRGATTGAGGGTTGGGATGGGAAGQQQQKK